MVRRVISERAAERRATGGRPRAEPVAEIGAELRIEKLQSIRD